mmetsp:Transcript_24416/g.44168  ORF Transcript_24416/g.44168 Transcript_24416/m.44168 type:complete len:235 (+) Transcript_24416:1893-2597(+)
MGALVRTQVHGHGLTGLWKMGSYQRIDPGNDQSPPGSTLEQPSQEGPRQFCAHIYPLCSCHTSIPPSAECGSNQTNPMASSSSLAQHLPLQRHSCACPLASLQSSGDRGSSHSFRRTISPCLGYGDRNPGTRSDTTACTRRTAPSQLCPPGCTSRMRRLQAPPPPPPPHLHLPVGGMPWALASVCALRHGLASAGGDPPSAAGPAEAYTWTQEGLSCTPPLATSALGRVRVLQG